MQGGRDLRWVKVASVDDDVVPVSQGLAHNLFTFLSSARGRVVLRCTDPLPS